MAHDPPLDLWNACWRCQHWDGFTARVHAKCTRVNATLEASPATGCVYWMAESGNELLPDRLPEGFSVTRNDGV